MNLVYGVISRKYPTFKGDTEIISAGMMGLCNATLKWDEAKGKFSTYACACIKRAIAQELRARRPYTELVSLDAPITEDLTLGDTIAGETDNGYVDYTFLRELSQGEKLIFDLKTKGYDVADIKVITGYDTRKIQKILRIIRSKYRNINVY